MAVVYIPLDVHHECKLPKVPSNMFLEENDLFNGPADDGNWYKQAASGVFFECDGCTKV